ncbi:MAG: putative ABC-type transport system, periplasmic component/surface lipoprotein [Frankiales bacterium]|nr:putative ABC-type transport system, periplasmic component/surface lipoprotein [Frankiales bacterium]
MRIQLRVAAGASIVLLALAGCGGSSGSGSGSGAADAASTGKLKVAFILPGSPTDQGYNADGKRSADLVKKELGADVAVTDNVAVPNQADVYRQYAAKGYNVVIGWGGQFTDGATSVSAEFPKTDFIVVNGASENGSNLGSIDTDIEQWEFVRGFAAAKLSKSGTIAWVGGQCFPATAANLHGVEEGAKYANPGVKVLSTFTGDFEDPTKAQQATQALMGNGADVITGNLNNGWFGVYKAAEGGQGVTVANEWIESSNLAPGVIAAAVLKSQGKFVVDVLKKVQDGAFGGKHYQFPLPADWGPALSQSKLLPNDVYQAALDVQKKISDGSIKPKHDETCPK